MPKNINLPSTLVLIPFSPAPNIFLSNEKPQIKSHLGSTLMIYSSFFLITGFMGYANLLTLLSTIPDIENKEFFFLGTAGSVNQKINHPICLNVTQIWSSSYFRYFSHNRSFSLNSFPDGKFSHAKGVSVDIPMRETQCWLKKQHLQKMDIVEMELFPLRVFLKKSFYALVVVTDWVDSRGIHPFSKTNEMQLLFKSAFQYIVGWINEKKSYPHA